ncbi:hypothetical protein FRB95_003102 [Tulasnella sp. JGI-2019a]|nr:hypothetical protein FRB95_003102 [Tulasnella sp. JGI-2019a]
MPGLPLCPTLPFSPSTNRSSPSLRSVASDTSPPPRHHAKFYYDQLVFLIENTFHGVPRFLLRSSGYFTTILELANSGGTFEGATDDNPIRLTGITCFEMESLLAVLDARCMDGPHNLKSEEWAAALHLATMWHFDAARKYAIQNIESQYPGQAPLERIVLAGKCQVGPWLHPAYLSLCNRSEPLTIEEGEVLGLGRALAICRLRERRAQGKCGNCYKCRQGYGVENCQNRSATQVQLTAIATEKDLAIPFVEDAPAV